MKFANHSPASDRNQDVIWQTLQPYLPLNAQVFEIGSGSGQHMVYFCQRRPDLIWQPSELAGNIESLRSNSNRAQLTNIKPPITVEVGNDTQWPQHSFDLIYTANTLHIMSAEQVAAFFAQIRPRCSQGSRLIVYGPFKYQNQFTSDSNAAFDVWLKDRDSASGIRDFEQVNKLAEDQGFSLLADHQMPANNQLLVWQLTR